MPGGILWLASYPKSGNTWVRIFLENLFRNADQPASINDLGVVSVSDALPALYEEAAGRPVSDLSDDDLDALRPTVQATLASRPETTIVKTHNRLATYKTHPLISLDQTMGAIYVVRNVFDVVVSLADHYGFTLDQAIDGLASDDMKTRTTPSAIVQHLGPWGEHVQSWTEIPGFEPLVLRYEDLRTHPFREFSRVVKFLKLPAKPDRIKKAIRFSNFEEVSRQEKHGGFKERVRADQVFFRGGKVGGWRDHLSDRQVQTLIEHHRPVLRALRYLDKRDRPTV
jgi:hypothetical protein